MSMNGTARISRRGALRSGAWLAALGAAGLDRPAFSQSTGFDWKRFKGQSIEVALSKSPRADLLQKYQPEFEAITGITVGSEQIPEQQNRQRNAIQFASGHAQMDVAQLGLHVEKRLFGRSKWLEDLRPYLADPTLTAPDFDPGDFSAGGRLFSVQEDGRMDTLPLSLDYALLYWNKEIFAAKGIAAPETFADMVKAAAALTDPSKRQYGFVGRGIKNANVYIWTSAMLGWGEDSVIDGKLNTTGPAAVESAALLTKLCREYGPPGISGFNWNESQTSFMQGNVAMWFDSSAFGAPLEDPTKSRIAGKVGYMPVPAGPKTRAVGLTGDGIGVSATSSKKQAAYFYCQWATAKAMQARFLQTGAGVGARNSTLSDPAIVAGLQPGARGWVECMKISAPMGRPCLPNIIPVTEFRDTFGIALTNMIGGADPAAELKKATDAFAPVLAKSEAG